MIIALIDEAVCAGARLKKACAVVGLCHRTLQRWRKSGAVGDLRAGPKRTPSNKLSEQERQNVLAAANRPEYRELSPKQIVPRLADDNEYIASESTFYRILREEGQLAHRRSSAPKKHSRPQEFVATGPGQVMTWDITYLPASIRGIFFYLYLFMDIWSRKIVGWEVHESESPQHAATLITQIIANEGLGADTVVLHADNGGPMKGATMLATLHRLGVTPSFSRPHVSDDNPFSEALFGTFKGRPGYAGRRFEDITAARQWVEEFVTWYNHSHLHSSIEFVTPADRHDGNDIAILDGRRALYAQARANTPQRWSRHHRPWQRPEVVVLNPRKNTIKIIKKTKFVVG